MTGGSVQDESDETPDRLKDGTDRNPKDAKFCPSCGESLPFDSVRFYGDNLLNRYRTVFECPSCGYDGEVIRGGGLDDMTLELVKNDGNPMVPTPGGDSA